MTSKKNGTPIIICAGENGRVVIYGRVSKKPLPGKPVTLHDARMVLYWDRACGGLFGLAAKGPKGDTRITHVIPETTATVWKESLAVTPEASKEIEKWPSA